MLALTVLYSVFETLYTAYFFIGMTAYLFALLSYLPYIVSLARMLWRDTENRRLIFYRNCIRLWLAALAIDLWVIFNLKVDVDEQCETVGFLPDE